MTSLNDYPITLINLPRTTVLFNILSMCNLKDLFNLRCLSKDFILLIDYYLKHCKRLRLASCFVKNTDALNMLATRCYSVKHLNLSKCFNLNFQDKIFTIILKNNCKHITEINLSYCNSITSKSMQFIIVNCKQLDTILLIGCSWFNSGVLNSLTFHQSKLHTVDFTRCVNLSEKSILKFIVKFPTLKYLSIAFIRSVTGRVLVALSKHCPVLEHLIISGTQFSLDGFSDIPEFRPNIIVMF